MPTIRFHNQRELKLARSCITITWFREYGRVKRLADVVFGWGM
jgi:hypothetical protein